MYFFSSLVNLQKHFYLKRTFKLIFEIMFNTHRGQSNKTTIWSNHPLTFETLLRKLLQ